MVPNQGPVFIVGLVGEIAAGKSTCTDYLVRQYGAVTFKFSTPLREALRCLRVPETREHMVAFSEATRGLFGNDLLARVMAENVQQAQARIVTVDGIRRMDDIAFLLSLPAFRIIEISADARTRYTRLVARGENPDDTTKTWETFQAEAELPTEASIRSVAAHAHEHITNNGSFAEFYAHVDTLVHTYAGPHH